MTQLIRYTALLAVACSLLSAQVQDNTYVLRPNDTIRLEVYGESDLSVSVRILKTGHASFPLIGSLEISGLSVVAAAEKIRELYGKDYLVDPKLTLTVQEYATEFISVIGAVRSPGQIPMPVSGNIDLAAVMATAGGLSADADPNGVRLIRASGEASTYSISSIVNGPNGRVGVEAGDRVIVNQSAFVGKKVTFVGEVGRQGALAFPLSGKLDLISAIAMAGGLTDLARPNKITINRKGKTMVVDYEKLTERADQPLFLEPDDVISVAERMF